MRQIDISGAVSGEEILYRFTCINSHRQSSLKVPNIEFDFDVCVKDSTLGFDINAVIRRKVF